MESEALGEKRIMKNEVGFVFDHATKAKSLCWNLAIADTFKGTPADQWKGLLAKNSQGKEAMPMSI